MLETQELYSVIQKTEPQQNKALDAMEILIHFLKILEKIWFFQKSQGMMGNNNFGGQADSELGQRHSAKFRPAGELEAKNGLWVYYRR